MDKRVIRTRKNLNKALVELLKEKPLTKITVSELCDMAMINRSTYYLHYKDAHDQYEQLEESLYREFIDTMDHFIRSHRNWFSDMIMTDSATQVHLLEEIFSYIKKNAAIYGTILPINQGNEFLAKLYNAGHERFFEVISQKAAPENLQRFEYFFAFVANGCMGILRQWVERGMPESPREMSILSMELVKGGNKFLSD